MRTVKTMSAAEVVDFISGHISYGEKVMLPGQNADYTRGFKHAVAGIRGALDLVSGVSYSDVLDDVMDAVDAAR